MKRAIQKVIDKIDLSQREITEVLKLIMNDKVTEAQLAAFLVALRLKGEAITEITGLAKAMKKYAVKMNIKKLGLLDTAGTGDDLINTFNISTLAAFVVAAAGVPVLKHCGRAVSSGCGSADVLEELGVNLELEASQIKKCLDKVGLGFVYAPNFNPVLKKVHKTCQELGVRTIFNLLMPLINPGNASVRVLGVYDEKLTTVIAGVLRNLGVKRAYVVHGIDGMDEVTTCGLTRISELKNGVINTYSITPEDYGVELGSLNPLLGGTVKENAQMSRVILSGRENSPRTDIVLLNAALALLAANKAKNLQDALQLGHKVLASGKAYEKLLKTAELTRTFSAKRKTKNTKTKNIRKKIKKR